MVSLAGEGSNRNVQEKRLSKNFRLQGSEESRGLFCYKIVELLSLRHNKSMSNSQPVKRRILVVDDEPDTVELIEYNLRNAGFEVLVAYNGVEALQRARREQPDLIVLDLMLPEIEGLEVCKTLRRDPMTSEIPIVMCTARASEIDRIVGLEVGADDYLTKPFSPRELVLRVKNLLKRIQPFGVRGERICVEGLLIDLPRHRVEVEAHPVELTATEFKLLAVLAQRMGRVQTREVLLRDVWGYENWVDTRTVDTHIRRLREKLGPAAKWIETIRGVGYRFREP